MPAQNIRRVEPGDLPQLCNLYFAFHEFHVQVVPDRLATLGSQEEYDCTKLIADLRSLLCRNDVALFVAEDAAAQRLIGFAEVYVREDGANSAVVSHRYAHLQSLYVEEVYRGLHIGMELVGACSDWAIQRRATEIRLDIWEFASGPLHFYERLRYRTLRRTLVHTLPTEQDSIAPGYDLTTLLKEGTRGKYVAQYQAVTNLVLLDPDVAAAFPTAESVNAALRLVMQLAAIPNTAQE